jgi:hypothetical protein
MPIAAKIRGYVPNAVSSTVDCRRPHAMTTNAERSCDINRHRPRDNHQMPYAGSIWELSLLDILVVTSLQNFHFVPSMKSKRA